MEIDENVNLPSFFINKIQMQLFKHFKIICRLISECAQKLLILSHSIYFGSFAVLDYCYLIKIFILTYKNGKTLNIFKLIRFLNQNV